MAGSPPLSRTTLGCPRCTVPLHQAAAGPVLLHGCGRCGGIWLDNEGSRRVLSRLESDALGLADRASQNAPQRVDVERAIRCPVCAAALHRVQGGDTSVMVDICHEHGTWFDRDELRQVSLVAERRRHEARARGDIDFGAVAAGGAVVGAAAVGAAVVATDPGTMAMAQRAASNAAAEVANLASGAADVAANAGGAVLEFGGEALVEGAVELVIEGAVGLIGAIFEGL